jgi:DNA-binding SARP family transcriptional activator
MAQNIPGASNEDGATPGGTLAADGTGRNTGHDCTGGEPDAFERWWTGTDAGLPGSGHHRNGSVPPATGNSAYNDACIPSLVMMRVGAAGMEVVLSPAPKGRFGWFSLKDDGTAHVLDSEIGIEDLEALASERWPAWPALVALGEAEGSTVLLNLEHAGSLAVEGPPERVSATLAAIVLQLATQPWADEMLGGLYTVGDTPLTGHLVERVQHVERADAMDLAERLDGIASARQELAGAALLSTMRAVACEALPNVAVAFGGTPANALRCLAEAAVPERSGVALVAAGPVGGAAWQLSLEGARAAVLNGPAGEVAEIAMGVGADDGLARGPAPRPTSLQNEQAAEDGDEGCTRGRESGARVVQQVEGVGLAPGWGRDAGTSVVRVELMSAFDSEEVVLLSEAVGGAQGEELIDITAGPSGDGPRADIHRRDVEVRLLGPVDVAGGDLGAVDRSRVMAALGVLAYLASHPRPVPADELAGALWPLDATKDNYGGPQRKTVMNAISRARAALGYGVNGKERLVLTPQGYRLSDEVGSDWERFQQHVSIARMLGGAEAIVHLRSALELVRGEPFGGALASQFFEWVASEHLDMTLSAHAVDVAQDLGELALAAGDFAAVYWAVDKGLALEPTREELFRLWMHALGREGRPAKVDDVYRRLKLVLRQRVHPLHEPQRESWEVWRSYTAVESVAGGAPPDW